MCSIWREANSLASALGTNRCFTLTGEVVQTGDVDDFPPKLHFFVPTAEFNLPFWLQAGNFLICLVRLCLRSGGNNSHLEAVNCSAQRKKKTTSSGPGTTTGPLKWSVQRQKTVAESPVPGALYIFTYILKSEILGCSSSFCNWATK